MFRTALSLAMENGTSTAIEGVEFVAITASGINTISSSSGSHPNKPTSTAISLHSTQWLHWKELQQNLLYSIVNIVVACKETLDEIMSFNRDFLSFLVSSFGNFANALYQSQLLTRQQQSGSGAEGNGSTAASAYLPMLNTIANSLIIFCQTKHAAVIQELSNVHGIPTIKQVLQWFYGLANSNAGQPQQGMVVSAANHDNWIIIVQCIEMLLNLFIDNNLSHEVATMIDAGSLITGLTGLLNACKVPDMPMPRPADPATNSTADVPDTMDQDGEDDDDKVHEIVIPQGRSEISSSVPMFDIELIEVISDLLSSIAGHVTQHFSSADEMAFLMSMTTNNTNNGNTSKKGNNKKGNKNNTPILTPGQQRSLQLIQLFEQNYLVNQSVLMFTHLRTRFLMFLTAPTIVPTSPSLQLPLILHEGVKVLHVMEKMTSLVNDLYALKAIVISETVSHVGMVVHWELSLPVILEHLTALLEYVNNTTASLDESTKSGKSEVIYWTFFLIFVLISLPLLTAVEVWRAKEEEDLLTLKSSIITQASAALDILAQFLSHVALQANPSQHLIVMTEEDMKNVAVHLLRWISLPQLEIVFSAVNVMTLLANFEEKQQLIPIQVMMLLTNGLLNRLAAPSAYAIESDKNLNKSLNVKRSTLLVMDSIMDALMDLHSSDELSYHSMFMKLKSLDKLKAALYDFHQRYQQMIGHLDPDDRDKLEETAGNLTSFIEYKENNFR
jgi:hypothetical protein